MFRHIVIAAWRDLARSPVQSCIAIGGLAIGLAAAILAGLFTASQYSYDHFIPGSGQVYYPSLEVRGGGDIPRINRGTPLDLAKYLQQALPEIEVARLQGDYRHFRHGNVEAQEELYWADPNIFQLLHLPVLYGRLKDALSRPDSIVISRAVAEKYFGRANVAGETLQLDRQHSLTVTAVIADFPANASTLRSGIFASGQAAFSTMAVDGAEVSMGHDGSMSTKNSVTLARISPNQSLDKLEYRASAMVDSFVPKQEPRRRGLRFIRMDRLNLAMEPFTQTKVLIFDAVALLTLFLACVNFVNLAMASANRRGVEIGIRKATGATRWALVAQLLGEAMAQALLALIVASMLVEWLLPIMNDFLKAGAVFDYWHDPLLAGALVSGTLLVGVLAGAYPALVLSSFRPAWVLKGLTSGSGRAMRVRQVLVTVQFAILVTLMVAAGIIFLQYRYATRDSLRLNTDQMLAVKMPECKEAFRVQAAALPGVHGAACSGATLQPDHNNFGETAAVRGGGTVGLSLVSVGYGLLELYDLKPVAGRFFAADHGGDAIPDPAAASFMVHYVLNETAVHKLGFTSPQAALGQAIKFVPYWVLMGLPAPKSPDGSATPEMLNSVVIGVVRDFALTSGDKGIDPIAYSVGVPMSGPAAGQPGGDILSIKLNGRDIPETLTAIDTLWREYGPADPVTASAAPINRTFVDAYIAELEIDMLHEAEAFTVFAGIAIFLGCLGIFGLSLSATKRRIKEIGVRKAMGATSADMVALLLWQFAQPVLWANVIAWPVAWWLMRRWLAGFAYHVDLHWWVFAAASLGALLIALLTVAGQAWATARQKPVLALRYE